MWWKRFKRRRRFARKRNLTYLLFLFILLSMGIGYAVLNTTLGIDGTSQLANAKWDIHFDNIQVKEGSVTPTSAATITDDTTVSFSVTLENPGDFYEFNVDVVNAGTINAMIDTISIQPVLTDAQQKYLDYIVTYSDGVSLGVNQRLDAGDSETLRIAFIYKEADDPDDYPDEDEDITMEVAITYSQATNDVIDVDHPSTLYGVLKDAVEDGAYAREYTGAHKDSFTQNSSKKIYYWYADDDTEGTTIQNMNNVIFANQCWQMIRTTDTGGVKMIYNGEPENGQCLNNRANHVGYSEAITYSPMTGYWYGTDYTYDSTNQTFSIAGDTEYSEWNSTTGPNLVGKYTCGSSSESYSCPTLYYVESYVDDSSAVIILFDNDSHYSRLGTMQYNMSSNSVSYVGYMYGDVYESNSITCPATQNFVSTEILLDADYLDTFSWYANSVDFNNIIPGEYSLVNPFQVNSATDFPNLVHTYTYMTSDINHTCENIYYIVGVNGNIGYYKKLSNGNLIGAYEPIVFGDSITDNGNGTYTLNNPQSITLTDWVNNYANYYRKYTCNGSSTTCEHPRLIVVANPSNYGYIDAAEKIVIAKRRNGLVLEDTKLVNKEEWISNYNSYSDYKYTCNNTSTTCTESNLRIIDSYNAIGYKYAENHYYGSSVTWDGTKYTLVNPIGLENYKNLDTLSTHHYTCVNAGSTTCTRVAYIHHYSSGTKYYLLLENGETSISSKLDDMFTKNSTSSTIKNSIDAWYKRNILEYDNYIDDTIYCNNRNILNLNGWNPNGGVLNESFQFNGYVSTTDLSCTQVTDQFSVSNPSAQLKYKIGLPTFSEMNLLNNSVIRKSGVWYWLGSPCCFDYRSCIRSVDPDGDITDRSTVSKIGIRPTITLKSKTIYSSGDGSMADPYVVDTD